jgi:hypothetical protein
MEALLPSCPEVIREAAKNLIDEGVLAENAVAVLLATAAATLGGSAMGERRHLTTLGFNIVIAHHAAHSLPLFDAAVAPFVDAALDLQVAACSQGPVALKRQIAARLQDLEAARGAINPPLELIAEAENALARLKARLGPMILTNRVRGKEVGAAVARSFDGAVMLTGIGGDVGSDFLRLKADERAGLAEVLTRSWTGVPLSFGRHTLSGAVTALWQTRCPVKTLVGRHGFAPEFLSPPLLYLDDDSTASPPVSPPWRACIDLLFNYRCRQVAAVYRPSDPAESALQAYEAEIACVPANMRQHAWWLPGLALRLAALFAILESRSEAVIDEAMARRAITITRLLGRQHLATVAQVLVPADADIADRKRIMHEKILVRQPLSRRELWRSYDQPKAEWFVAALEALLCDKKVIFDEQKRLICVSNP